jgi:hypothetical protein
MSENIFNRIIPKDAAKKLAEMVCDGIGESDQAIAALIAPRRETYALKPTVRFHVTPDFPRHIDDDVDLSAPVTIRSYTAQLDLDGMSGREFDQLRRATDEVIRRGMTYRLAQEFLMRYGDPGVNTYVNHGSDPYAPDPYDAFNYMYRGMVGTTPDRHDGEPYGFVDYTGKTLKDDPTDKQMSTVWRDDELEVGDDYRGNLYAYKTLFIPANGKPRSYYKARSNVWREGWITYECMPSSASVAGLLHAGSEFALPGRCECGFHAWYALPPTWESPRLTDVTSCPVLVQIGGDIIWATRGIRAERVKVIAVLDCGNDDDNETERKEGNIYRTRDELGAFFNVPVLRPEDVEVWAAVEGYKSALSRMQDALREEV